MSQELLNELNRNLVAFESAGMSEDVAAVKAKIKDVEKSMQPKPKKTEKKKTAASPVKVEKPSALSAKSEEK